MLLRCLVMSLAVVREGRLDRDALSASRAPPISLALRVPEANRNLLSALATRYKPRYHSHFSSNWIFESGRLLELSSLCNIGIPESNRQSSFPHLNHNQETRKDIRRVPA